MTIKHKKSVMTPKKIHYAHLSSIPPSALVLGNHWSAFCHYRLVYISCKWNHIVCTPLGLASSTQNNAFEIHPRCWVYPQSMPFHCCTVLFISVLFHHVYVLPFAFPFSRWWPFRLFLDFDCYEYSCDDHLYLNLCGDVHFNFFGVLTWEWNGWTLCYVYIELFLKMPVSPSGFTILHAR